MRTLTPIEIEVMWNRLIAVVNEQAAALIRTSFTPVVREAGDISAGVFDPQGRMLAQAVTGTPGHINSMATSIHHFLAEFPPEALEPGDVLITNDPWKVSGHTNDVTVCTPIFRAGRLVAFFANTCHHVDIGGRFRSAEGRDVYEEGFYIPICKLFRRGEPDDNFFRLFKANVRKPDLSIGDLYGQTAGNDVGGAALVKMLDEFKLDELAPLGEEIVQRSEAAMRAAVQAVPDGVYRHETAADGFDQEIVMRVAVTVRGDELAVDYAGTSPQSRYGINVVLNYTHAYTTYAIKCAIAPDVPNNEGSFRPVTVTAPEGSILNCRYPAPVSARSSIGHFLPGLVHGALVQAVPERVLAEGAGPLWIVHWNYRDREGRPGAYSMFAIGGTGARPTSDGLSATAFPSGITGVSAEVMENISPLLVRAKRLRTDSGGAGRFRGGLGQEMELAYRGDQPYYVSPLAERFRHQAQGFRGGGPGAFGGVRLSDGQEVQTKAQLRLAPDQAISLRLPGGGGFGDPLERDPALVLADVLDELVSPTEARERYGVVLDASGDTVDAATTERERQARRGVAEKAAGATE
jgi:N-methylhydantoinase B